MDRTDPAEDAAFAKISRRLVWFLMLMVIVNFLDRSNIGFAALTMNKSLGLNATTFGLALTMFSLVYVLCEIPSNIAMARFGARLWLARIMITWGIAAAACALVTGAWSLIGLRMLVGAAEAGFIPGVILYITYWLPQYRRAGMQARFLIAQPIAIAGGSLISGLIMGMDGVLGIAGWRWLFLLEGLPAIVLGLVALSYLSDRPGRAAWLSPAERSLVEAAVTRDAEGRERPADRGRAVWRLILSRNMLLISFAYMTLVFSYTASAYWLPQIVRSLVRPGTPFWEIGAITAVPYLLTAAAMPFWSRRSDVAQERYWHSVIPMVLAASGWILAGLATDPVVRMVGITAETVFSTIVWSIFFTMPSAVLPRRAHPVGIAALNTVGMLGAVVSPLVIGILRDRTGGFAAALVVIGAVMLGGAALMLFVPRRLLAQTAPLGAAAE